jgi:hypothetical protein
MRRPLRIATTAQWERSVREAGFEARRLPELPTLDFHRSLGQRLQDGTVYGPFLEANDIDLVIDFNTEALTLCPSREAPNEVNLTTAIMGIPYVACYLDPVTSTMGQVRWSDHWQILESRGWIKWIWETAHAEELLKLGVPNVLTLPMGAANDDFDRSALPEPDPGPAVAFMGHPASSWFRSSQAVDPSQLLVGLTAAAVRADLPELPFHKIYFDLHQFDVPPGETDDALSRAEKSARYYEQKFVYNAYLAVKQRDRFARFLKAKLGDLFELVGDHWEKDCGLPHTPRIWDPKVLHARIRRVPICLNLMKGNLETGLNIRHFEITAYGGFMLTYASEELSGCFEVGRECEVFRHEAELLEKIGYYLEHVEERRAIALAGQQRTLSEHLYSHRLLRLVEMLRESGILPRIAPARAAPPAVLAPAAVP